MSVWRRVRSPRRAHWSARDTDAGYTLVEIMVTLGVMGVVLALVFPVVSTVTLITSLQWTVDPTTSTLTQTTWPTTWTTGSATPVPVGLAGPLANVSSSLYPVFSMATTPVPGSSSLTTSLVNLQLYLKGSTGTAVNASKYTNSGTQYVFLQTSVSVLSSTLAAGNC